MKNNIMNKKGFTIIETLVAVTILMISIAGPLTIAQKSLMASIYARDQVTASFLAQDFIEKIKNERSNALMSGTTFNAWVNSYANPCTASTVLRYQVDDKYLEVGGGGGASKFSCLITLTSVSQNQAKAEVSISWNSGTISNVVKLQSYFFNVLL